MQQKIMQITHLCNQVGFRHTAKGETLEFSEATRQELIDDYQTKKAELKSLVEELP